MNPAGLTPRRILFALLAIALLLRLGWGWRQSNDPAGLNALPDQVEYLTLANNLLHERELKFVDPRFDSVVVAYRMPGYPLFLAACGASIPVARLAQSLLDTATVLAAYLLARRWLTPRPALLSAALVAFNPFLVYFSALLLSETLYTALLAWGMVLLAGRRQWALGSEEPRSSSPPLVSLRVPRFLAGLLLLALAIHVRPSGLGLPLLLGAVAAVMNRPPAPAYQLRPRWRLPVISTSILLILLVLFPWAWRNHRLLGDWIWTTTNSGITLYDGFHPGATGASDQSFVSDMPFLSELTEVQRSQWFNDLARQWIAENPLQSAQLALVKIGRTWSPVPLSQDYGSNRLYVIVGLLFSLPLDMLVLLGLLFGRLPRSAKAFLLLPALYFTAVHALSVGSLRYRLPVEVPMAVLAAAAWPARSPAPWRRAEAGEDDWGDRA